MTLVAESPTQRPIYHLDITADDWLEEVSAAVLASVEHQAHLYFGNALRRLDLGPYGQGKQQPQELLSLGHLFAEADYGSSGHAASGLASRDTVLGALRAFTPAPDLVVSSGNGFHCYWLLVEPIWFNQDNFAAVKSASAQWQKTFRDHFAKRKIPGIDSIMNLDRILRVPGSINFKSGEQRPVEIL